HRRRPRGDARGGADPAQRDEVVHAVDGQAEEAEERQQRCREDDQDLRSPSSHRRYSITMLTDTFRFIDGSVKNGTSTPCACCAVTVRTLPRVRLAAATLVLSWGPAVEETVTESAVPPGETSRVRAMIDVSSR